MLTVEMLTCEKNVEFIRKLYIFVVLFFFHARLIITKKEYTKTLSDIIIGIFSFICWFALHH